VLEEVGMRVVKPRDSRIVERLERRFSTRPGRTLVPNLSDWTLTGKSYWLAWLPSMGYEQIGQARLTNDVLVAMSAGAARDYSHYGQRTGILAASAQFHPFQWANASLMKIIGRRPP